MKIIFNRFFVQNHHGQETFLGIYTKLFKIMTGQFHTVILAEIPGQENFITYYIFCPNWSFKNILEICKSEGIFTKFPYY